MMFGLNLIRNLQSVGVGDRVLIRWSNLFDFFGKGRQVFKISTPKRLGALDQIKWLRRFKYGLLYRGWFKDSSIYRRIDSQSGESAGRKFAYVIVEDWDAFVLEGKSIPELLEDATLHPEFKRGGLFVKVM